MLRTLQQSRGLSRRRTITILAHGNGDDRYYLRNVSLWFPASLKPTPAGGGGPNFVAPTRELLICDFSPLFGELALLVLVFAFFAIVFSCSMLM
jgi:hypothetical protein